ncbi:MAG: hypothetical protein EHM36_14985 [Deltaproteobacteria bacterium]|nr:MAG: hypothetical protein EHM36_14985 [Deltaproteobacteria bacterium]
MIRISLVAAGCLLFGLVFISNPAFTERIPQKTPELVNQGRKIYGQNCVVCHGPKGDGQGSLGLTLKTPPTDFTKPFDHWNYSRGNPQKIFEAITNGVPGTAMAKFHYAEETRWGLVYYVMQFSESKTN